MTCRQIQQVFVKLVKKWMANGLMSRHGDATLHGFLSNLVSVVLYFFLVMAVIGILGINTSSLVALLASAGLAVGMSLGGTLQNFAGGVLIIMFRPNGLYGYKEFSLKRLINRLKGGKAKTGKEAA